MAKPTVKQRSAAVLPVNDRRSAPSLDVVAPLDVKASAGRGAAALSEALGIVAPGVQGYLEGVEEKNAVRAKLDAESGVVDQKRMSRSRAYEDAYITAKAEASFIERKKLLIDWYDKDFDKGKDTPAELDQHIIEFFKENYGAEDDPRVARAIAPKMQELREALVNRQHEVTRKAVQDEHQANQMKIVEDALDSQKTVDANAIKDDLAKVLDGGRSQAVRVYAQMVGELAIKRKDPDLINALIPEKWADGTPGAYSIPEVAAELNQKRYYADLQRQAAESKTERETKLAREAKATQTKSDLMLAALAGDDIEEGIVANRGIFDDDDISKLVNFNMKMREDREKGSPPDPVAVAELEYKLYSGAASQKDILSLANDPLGPLGTGKEFQAAVHSLLNTAKDANEHIRRKTTDADYRFYADQLEEAMPIQKNLVTGVPLPASVAQRRMAVTRFHELTTQKGMSASEAYASVLKDVPKLHDDSSIHVDAAAPRSATEITQALRIGRLTPALKAKYPPASIGKMVDEGELDVDTANKLIDLYN